ncbi:MAG TPA: hypothetical protein VGG64_02970 [Pirellulales bacterium]
MAQHAAICSSSQRDGGVYGRIAIALAAERAESERRQAALSHSGRPMQPTGAALHLTSITSRMAVPPLHAPAVS